jgi:co-chaperonin GroES (HSP10)
MKIEELKNAEHLIIVKPLSEAESKDIVLSSTKYIEVSEDVVKNLVVGEIVGGFFIDKYLVYYDDYSSSVIRYGDMVIYPKDKVSEIKIYANKYIAVQKSDVFLSLLTREQSNQTVIEIPD